MSPAVTIQDFFDSPVRNWRVTRENPSLVRFGLIWKIFDLVGLRTPEFQVPILAPREADLGPCYLWGGVSGTEFLVAPLGLDQPKAGKGVVSPGLVTEGTMPIKTIRYKTLGVSDRQCCMGFQRWNRHTRQYESIATFKRYYLI